MRVILALSQLATAAEMQQMEDNFYMNPEGSLWWRSSSCSAAEEASESEDEGGAGKSSKEDDARMPVEQSLHTYFTELVTKPAAAHLAELSRDYLRLARIVSINPYRKGAVGPKADEARCLLRAGVEAAGQVMALRYVGGETFDRIVMNETTIHDPVHGLTMDGPALKQAIVAASPEIDADLPPSLLRACGIGGAFRPRRAQQHSTPQEPSRKRPSMAPPSVDEPSAEPSVSHGGRGRGGGAVKRGRGRPPKARPPESERELVSEAETIQQLRRELNSANDQLVSQHEKHLAEVTKLHKKIAELQRRYGLDMSAWVGPFNANYTSLSIAKSAMASNAELKAVAQPMTLAPMPWDDKRRPFNTGSASARRSEVEDGPVFEFARRNPLADVELRQRGPGRL